MDDQDLKKIHRKFAVDFFNQTWDLIEKENRDQSEIDRMINSAHASRYHWAFVGEAVNFARGEWQISRVYAVIRRTEPCLYHANRCLKITLENDLEDFDLAFAYEAMARAYDLANDEVAMAKYLTMAKDAGAQIQKKGDRDYFFSELRTIQPEVEE